MIRLPRREIPKQLRHRKTEILGEIRGNTMVDCVYNSLIAGEIEDSIPLANVERFVPEFLKDYQVDDLSKSLGRRYVFNINKPGYGKTLETIVWIKNNLIKDFKVLILCPKSVITTWEHQLNKYWPGWQNDGSWWITNYEQLHNEERLRRALQFVWDLVVLDESHTIKSFKSKITHVCFKLKSEARHCLSGTPIKNRPEDLAAQLKWLDPCSITSFTDFQNAFCAMERNAWGWVPRGLTKNKQMVDNLQRLLSLYCVGGDHKATGVAEPEYIKVRLKLDKRVKKLYADTVGEYDKETKTRTIDTAALLSLGVKISNPIEAATRRQQIASNPQLFDDSYKNVKFDWIIDWLRGTDEKVVIMSKFAQTIYKLDTVLRKHKFKVSTVRRGQSSRAFDETIEQWKNSGQVLLGTMGILGQGVDGLQENCNYLIFIDRAWTASDNEQAAKRIDRTGQSKKPIIYILQAIGTIDVRVEMVQHLKGLDASILLDPVPDDEE